MGERRKLSMRLEPVKKVARRELDAAGDSPGAYVVAVASVRARDEQWMAKLVFVRMLLERWNRYGNDQLAQEARAALRELLESAS